MGKEVAIVVLPFLLALTLMYPTLSAETTFVVRWTKENGGSWFTNGMIFHDGDSLGDSHYLYSLLDYTYIHIPTVNAITPI